MRFVARISPCLLGLLFCLTAYAQRDLGTITGNVTDPTGGAVAGAKITITEDATGLSYTVETSSSGDYARPALKPGTYTVTAEAPDSGAWLNRTSSSAVVTASEYRCSLLSEMTHNL